MPARSAQHAAFGEVLREKRKAVGLSQEGLANVTGLDRTYVSGIERGERNPSLTNILKLAAAVQTPPAELFARTEALLARPATDQPAETKRSSPGHSPSRNLQAPGGPNNSRTD